MVKEERYFLNTRMSQVSVIKSLITQLKESLDMFTYNIKRYHIPVTLVLFYTEEDISKELKRHIRISDGLKTIKLGGSYFNFIFLPFTNTKDTYSFVKEIEYSILADIKYLFYLEELEHEINNCYNYLNSFLFKITEK